MLAYREGDAEAFQQIFERYRLLLWGFFARRVNDRARAEDLTHETFIAIMKNAARYEPPGIFRSYVFGVAYNVLSDDRRRQPPAMSDIAAQPSLSVAPRNMDDVLHVRRAIALLDDIDREVILLREFEDLPYADIAHVLNIPVNTVRSRLFRARTALKEKLQ